MSVVLTPYFILFYFILTLILNQLLAWLQEKTHLKAFSHAAHYYFIETTCWEVIVSWWALTRAVQFESLLHSAALNFSKETCVLYECPEFGIRKSEQGNSVYDYYSAYARPAPKANVSCIPKVGVFQVHKQRNAFGNAEEFCDKEGGMLADITTDLHTSHLSSLMGVFNVSSAYAGLQQWNESQDEYLTSNGLPLSCLKFRAWAPNEPRPIKQNKCVYLTSKGYWKIKDCNKKLPFLCELRPQGPLRPCQRFKDARRKKRCLRKFLSSLPRKNRDPQCGDPTRKHQNENRHRRRRRKQKKADNSTESIKSS